MHKIWILLLIVSCSSAQKSPRFDIDLESKLEERVANGKQFCSKEDDRECLLYYEALYLTGDKKQVLEDARVGCEKNIGVMCTVLGVIKLGNADTNDGRNSLKKACDLKNARGCYILGVYEKLREKISLGLEYILRGCELGDQKACFTAYLFGPNDKNYSAKLASIPTQLEQKCRNGKSRICYSAGWVYYSSDRSKSESLYRKGCEDKDGDSCYAYRAFFSANITREEIANFESEACALGSGLACNSLAGYHKARSNNYLADRYYRDACALIGEAGCSVLGRMAYSYGNYSDAETYFRFGCMNFDLDSCSMLGYSIFYGDPSRREESYKYFRLACDYKMPQSCAMLALSYGQDGKELESEEFAKRACDIRYGDYCLHLGRYYLKKQQEQKALEYFTKSCDLGGSFGCLAKCFALSNRGKYGEARDAYVKGCSYAQNSRELRYCSDADYFQNKEIKDLDMASLKRHCNLDILPDFWPREIK